MGDSANSITAGVVGGTISGGGSSGVPNRVTDSFGTVGGGVGNQAGDNAGIVSDRLRATVGGGAFNIASGFDSTVSGGVINIASADASTVGGGQSNTASGFRSTVPGGDENSAIGAYSFAAGRLAKADNDGAFVWADSLPHVFSSTAANQFNVRCVGGARFVSAINFFGLPTAGVTLAAGGISWSAISDRNLKENFAATDGRDILERLSRIRITQWNLKSQDASIRHLGPMAQDFYSAFRLGEHNRHISTVDADGVALRAVQALYQISLDQERTITALKEKIVQQNQEVRELGARLETLEETVKPRAQPAVS